MEKEVQEEVKLLTTEDFIGSVGGSLGMFFGFSIYATFLYCIDQVLNRFFWIEAILMPMIIFTILFDQNIWETIYNFAV